MDDTKSELNDINNEHSNYSQDDEELLEECMGKINLDKLPLSITDTDFKPRFSLSLIPKRKNLDNSLDDYGIHDIVDDFGYLGNLEIKKEFVSIFRIFLTNELMKSTSKFYQNIKSSLNTIIEKSLNLIKLTCLKTEILKIENERGERESTDNCCVFTCFQNKKRKLEYSYNFESHVNNLLKCLSEINLDYKNILNDDKLLFESDFNYHKTNYDQNIINKTLADSRVIVRLKDEVDNYAELFNINKIIEKQDIKLKIQKKKIDIIDEYQTQSECIICMENERNVLFFPCLHLISCGVCAFTKICDLCPNCHRKIEKREYVLS